MKITSREYLGGVGYRVTGRGIEPDMTVLFPVGAAPILCVDGWRAPITVEAPFRFGVYGTPAERGRWIKRYLAPLPKATRE